MKYRVIGFSNHMLDNVSEYVEDDCLSASEAHRMCKALNDKVTDSDTYYYKVEDDNYKLYVWEP